MSLPSIDSKRNTNIDHSLKLPKLNNRNTSLPQLNNNK